MDDRTIIQLSTPRLTSAIHIIRLSGERSLVFLKQHTDLSTIDPQRVYHCDFFGDSGTIDSVICFFFVAPRSYTGEDMVEIHTHGSLLIVDNILQLAVKEGYRLALPGEFTYRAFLNGKLNLEQAEAIDGIIQAQNEFQKNNALKVLQGKLNFRFTDLKKTISSMLVELESVIEFPEEDIPEITVDKKTRYCNYRVRIDEIISYFSDILENYRTGRKLAEGFSFVIIGSPNSGKSTLFNLLLREGRAIVSKQKGTTRDYISEQYFLSEAEKNYKDKWDGEKLNGFDIVLYDTAGIHKQPESIEAMGIEKLPELVARSDLAIWLVSGWDCYREFIKSPAGKKMLQGIRENHSSDFSSHLWVFLNKVDLLSDAEIKRIKAKLVEDFSDSPLMIRCCFSLSEQPQKSRNIVETEFRNWIHAHYQLDYKSPAFINCRQGDIAQHILTTLHEIKKKINDLESEDIVAEKMRQLNHDLRELSLESGPEEVYDLLFSRFCVGK